MTPIEARGLDMLLRTLLNTNPPAPGITVKFNGGTSRHFTRADAERHVPSTPPPGEHKQ